MWAERRGGLSALCIVIAGDERELSRYVIFDEYNIGKHDDVWKKNPHHFDEFREIHLLEGRKVH